MRVALLLSPLPLSAASDYLAWSEEFECCLLCHDVS